MSDVRIKGSHQGGFEIKRLPMPGVVIEWECPKCGTTKQYDHGDDYLKFVALNEWKKKYLPECEECWEERGESYEHRIDVRVVMTVEVREVNDES